MTDVKGDLSGISQPGQATNPKVTEHVQLLKLKNFTFQGFPVMY
jgi:hypothetical protein